MIDFAQLQEIVKEHLEHDRAIRVVDAAGPTLEAAVIEAATLLDIPVSHVEYEVTERGFPGFLGTGKKDWQIRAYERITVRKKKVKNNLGLDEDEDLADTEDAARDGNAFVQLRNEGVFIKVLPPENDGKKVSVAFIQNVLNEKGIKEVDEEVLSGLIDEASGVYVKVCDFTQNLMNGTSVKIEISNDEMKAFMVVTRPGPAGCDLTAEEYISLCRQNKIHHGIKEDFLHEFADKPIYFERLEIAEGDKAVDGKDAYIQYYFETEQNKVRLREGSNGRIDFRELNIIQNVVQNQLLARKIPPEEGIHGKTLSGQMIPAKNGNDIDLPLGQNVHIGEDKATILADINGQVTITDGRISVEPVYTVDGNVDLGTGNIIFLGTVKINGNVEDGFEVKATGNIEVSGTVSKAILDAEGDIIINQGINGKGGGQVYAGKSVFARFIENTNVEAGNMVVADDGIINSQISAVNRIICRGKRATIIGGSLRAREEINAKVIGNATSGTDTVCEVGFDPGSKKELTRLLEIKKASEKELDEVKLNIQSLINIKKQRKSLPADREAYMQELMERRQVLISELKKNEEQIYKIQEFLDELKAHGRVSASSKVFPGVKVIIRDVTENIRSEYGAVTFVLEDELVRVKPYQAVDENILGKL